MNAEVGTRNAEQTGRSLPPRELESSVWLELLLEAGIATSSEVAALGDEAKQLVAITIASIHTAREGGRRVPRSAFRVPR